jgi:hypothetical protein
MSIFVLTKCFHFFCDHDFLTPVHEIKKLCCNNNNIKENKNNFECNYFKQSFLGLVVAGKQSSLSGGDEEGGATALSLLQSSSDVSTLEPATTRYLKLVAAAAAFSLAAFGLKKVVESLPK